MTCLGVARLSTELGRRKEGKRRSIITNIAVNNRVFIITVLDLALDSDSPHLVRLLLLLSSYE